MSTPLPTTPIESGHQLLNAELPTLITKAEDFARLCLEKGRPSIIGDRMGFYTIPIRSWYISLAARMRAHLQIDAIGPQIRKLRSDCEHENEHLVADIEKLLTKLSALRSKKISEVPSVNLHSNVLLLAHLLVAITEALTVATAFQIFGGTFLVSVVLFLSLFAFFYFLPFALSWLLERCAPGGQRVILGLTFSLILSALFWFLGSLREKYGAALNAGSTLSAIGFVIFNWMFLSLGMYLVYRRRKAETMKKELHVYELHRSAIKSVQDEIQEKQLKLETLKLMIITGEKESQQILSSYASMVRIIQAEYLEAVQRFKSIIITTSGGVIPDCFASSVRPLNIPEVQTDLQKLL